MFFFIKKINTLQQGCTKLIKSDIGPHLRNERMTEN